MLQGNGYQIYVVQYTPHRGQVSRFWDKEFHVKMPPRGNATSDMEPPDWDISAALPEFVARLSSRMQYDMVLASYVFLSGALAGVAPTIPTLIITYDIFTDHKQRFARMRGESAAPGVPLNARQEAMGLSRADLVIAITDDDRRYFVEQLKQTRVMTLPFIPSFQPLPPRSAARKNTVINVGFLGSSNRPNVDSVLAFIKACDKHVKFSLLVGGKVCDSLEGMVLPGCVQLLGRQLSVKEFYKQCHLIINPDMFHSGQKVKTVEALAHGMPLICTVTAASGLPAASRYHQAESAEACFHLVEEVATAPDCLHSLRQESILLYRRFREQCHESTASDLIGAVETIRALKSNQARLN
jgi:glycosyltransferase involved in cell wall biosynthesis